VRRLVEALALERPLVIVFDDIHWAEPTFLDLVAHLADRIRDAPVLLVCISRPELLETRPSWAAGKANATSILLDPLSENESDRLIENLELEAELDADLRSRITAAAEGNPLFVEEMLAMLSEGGETHGDVAVPPTIQALLSARLDRLDVAERDVVHRASVVGQEFARGAIVELVDGTAVDPPLASLVRKDLLRPIRDATPDEMFRFRHLLIRDAAYAALPKALRAELHERFARYLVHASGERVREVEEIVGYHLEQAYRHRLELGPIDEHARALATEGAQHLANAGSRADAHGDLPAAATLLERALGLFGEDDARRPDVQTLLGFALLELGQLERAEQQLAEAEEIARRSGARVTELSARVAGSLIRAQTDASFDFTSAMAAAENAIPELERLGADAATLARAWRIVVLARVVEYDIRALEDAAACALEEARDAGNARLEADALYWLALAIGIGPTPAQEALRRSEELLAMAPGPLSAASILTAVAGLHALIGDADEARRIIRRGRAAFYELGSVITAEGAAVAEAYVEVHAGQLEAAEGVLRSACEALEAIGDTAYLSVQQGLRAWILARLGRVDEALQLSERSRETAVGLVPHVYWRRARAFALSTLGQHEEAVRLAREALEVLAATEDPHTRAEILENLAEIEALAGGLEEARGALQDALATFERKGCVVCTRRTRERLHALRA
jgi:tetratricopeptide (TPR) repeat protein